MKLFFSICFFLGFFNIPETSDIRKLYPSAVNSESSAKEFASKLSDITKEDNKTLVAYKGASIVILSRYKKDISDKSKSFKEGAKLVEFAVSSEPNNIEIRLIRLSIQEKAPKILKYSANKMEDKDFLLRHYKEQSGNLKAYVMNFMMQSKSFTTAEKQTIN
jgi:tyrosine-protein phosphatase YwqE